MVQQDESANVDCTLARQLVYQRVQRLYRKNRKRCSEMVLNERWNEDEEH